MKRVLIFLFLLLCFSISNATNYYLSQNGSDNNSGTSTLTAWQSIGKLNSTVLQPGDSVFFETGSIFRGEVIISNGGTEGANIYFGKYGTGSLPVISGAELVSGWNFYSGNIYKAALTQSPSQLFANGKRMTIARFPNSGYLQFTTGLGNSGFECAVLTEPDSFWNNATVIMRTSDRKWEINKIKTFANQTAMFTSNSENFISSDFNFYLRNLIELIDTADEWYYDVVSKQLFFNAPNNADPSGLITEGSIFNSGMVIQNTTDYLTIENIEFTKQVQYGILVQGYSTNITIESCSFKHQGETGIQIPAGSKNFAISNNMFSDVDGNSLSVSNAENFLVTGNTMERTGIHPGYGSVYYPGNMYAMDFVNSDSFLVSLNTVDSTGGPALLCDLKNSSISKNVFRNSLLCLNALGSVFLYQTFNSVLEHNMVLNSIGNSPARFYPSIKVSAFLSEDSVTENSIINNTIGFSSSGLTLEGYFQSNTITGNTIYGCNLTALSFTEGITEGSNQSNKVFSNIFFGTNEYADLITFKSGFTEFTPALLDSNYYFNPYNFYISQVVTSPAGADFPKYFNLNLWQEANGFDSNSHESYFFRNRIIAKDTTEDNLLPNSFLTNNYDGWINVHPDSLQMLLDNSTPLDFGCLRLNMILNDPNINSGVLTGNFEIDTSKYYQFGFSSYSDNKGFLVLKFQENIEPYGYFNSPVPFPFNNTRQDLSRVIQPFKNSISSRLNIELDGGDSTVWIDNVTLYPVEVIEENPEKKCRLFINATNANKIFNLGDSIFYNLDQQLVQGSIELQPYTSTILIFDSSLISGTSGLVAENKVHLFPNPVMRGSNLHVQFPFSTNENEISIHDMNGKILFRKMLSVNSESLQIQIPQGIARGIYFIQIKQDERIFTGKIVVM